MLLVLQVKTMKSPFHVCQSVHQWIYIYIYIYINLSICYLSIQKLSTLLHIHISEYILFEFVDLILIPVKMSKSGFCCGNTLSFSRYISTHCGEIPSDRFLEWLKSRTGISVPRTHGDEIFKFMEMKFDCLPRNVSLGNWPSQLNAKLIGQKSQYLILTFLFKDENVV